MYASLSLSHTHTFSLSLCVCIYTHVTGDCCRLIYYIHRPLITDWLHILNSVKFSDPTFPIQISDPSLPSKFTIVGSENNDNKSEDEKEREFLRREQLKNISMRRLNEVSTITLINLTTLINLSVTGISHEYLYLFL